MIDAADQASLDECDERIKKARGTYLLSMIVGSALILVPILCVVFMQSVVERAIGGLVLAIFASIQMFGWYKFGKLNQLAESLDQRAAYLMAVIEWERDDT